jgi:hypothetical protein
MNHAEFSSRGGKARAKKLTSSARKRIASNAAKTRWKKKRSARLSNTEVRRKPAV